MSTLVVPATIHDRAVITVTGGVIPAGSTVTFRFYTNGTCSGSFTSETVAVLAGGTTAVVDSPPRTITSAAPFSYQAIFNSGDTSLVASAMSACEPQLVLQEGCPPPLVNVLLGDYNQGCVRRIFDPAVTDDDGDIIVWQVAARPVSSPSPQANGYYRRMIVKAANVKAGQTISVRLLIGPRDRPGGPRHLQETLTAPIKVAPGVFGFGLGPWDTSPFGGLVENTEVDLNMDIGLIGTNLRPTLLGGGPITLRGLEYHVHAKPLRRVSVYA